MTINIEYEAEKKLNLPYESIIEDVVNASLDYEKMPLRGRGQCHTDG